MGNDTGDSRVEGLNDQQLKKDYRGPLELRASASHPPTAQTPPAYAPRQVCFIAALTQLFRRLGWRREVLTRGVPFMVYTWEPWGRG